VTLSTDLQARPRAAYLALVVLGPFALGYFFSYLFRSVNAVVGPDLVRDIGLSAAELGLLTSAYLLAFALFQLPLGVLLDRIGPRKVQTGLLITAALGALLFAYGDDIVTLVIARALIGLGFAGGLMSGFKAVVIWVPAERRALANALVMSFGALGILVATVPVELGIQLIGWRMVFVVLAALTFIVAVLIFTMVPEKTAPPSGEGLGTQIRAVGTIFKDGLFWRLTPALASTAGAHIGIQTLWAGPWFRDVAGLDRLGVANHLMLVAIAFLIGILASGAIADWFVRRGVHILAVMNGFLLIFLVAELGIVLELTSLTLPLWFMFGMSGQVAILGYPWLAAYFGAARSGRAHTAINLILFATAFVVQALIGWVIDQFPPTAAGGYDPKGYQLGFGLCLLVQLISFFWYISGWRRLRAVAA
jgi:predicted MFS family arabinose efflux permease